METYKRQFFLNPEHSPSTGNITVFSGEVQYKECKEISTFVSISDCYGSARLHKLESDSLGDFLTKLKILRDTLEGFIQHLEKQKDETDSR